MIQQIMMTCSHDGDGVWYMSWDKMDDITIGAAMQDYLTRGEVMEILSVATVDLLDGSIWDTALVQPMKYWRSQLVREDTIWTS